MTRCCWSTCGTWPAPASWRASARRRVATTGAGISWSLGARDGERLERRDLVEAVRRIAAAVRVPVDADIETGYGTVPGQVADTVRAVVDAGAVGVTIEDGDDDGPGRLRPVGQQCARLAAARRAADDCGVPVLINARVDTYLRTVGDPATRLADTVNRATAYLGAGADSIFPAGAGVDAVVSLVRAVAAPVNVLAEPGGIPVAGWAAHGVARISIGPALAQLAYATVHRAARALLLTGQTGPLNPSLGREELDRLAGPHAAAPTADRPLADGPTVAEHLAGDGVYRSQFWANAVRDGGR
ncbi:isocitrate lyase/PEP mutase family protein [Actinoplanes nipponensis]|uniref:isocitrate lyase/PEP mutase family protein n=1 Tax=Actinoplanes nipponensis TaxID=135950 RepID=UPI0031E7EDED